MNFPKSFKIICNYVISRFILCVNFESITLFDTPYGICESFSECSPLIGSSNRRKFAYFALGFVIQGVLNCFLDRITNNLCKLGTIWKPSKFKSNFKLLRLSRSFWIFELFVFLRGIFQINEECSFYNFLHENIPAEIYLCFSTYSRACKVIWFSSTLTPNSDSTVEVFRLRLPNPSLAIQCIRLRLLTPTPCTRANRLQLPTSAPTRQAIRIRLPTPTSASEPIRLYLAT